MSATALPSSFLRAPSIQTRKALLLLDLQNDFVRPSGRLPVQNIQDFIDLIPTLVQSFRRTGDVVWVRTQYEDSRPLVDPDSGGERIVLDAGPLDSKKDKKKAGRDRQETENEDDTDPEAFLSGPDPACRAQTSGAQFPAPIVAAVDPENDIVIVKSDYSALQSPGLVLSLRSRFVTELYLCGSLSNVSVYATALDAARQGFALTLVEDCLGFRSFARHEEAIRRMADIMGANGISVQELLEEQEWQETHDIAHAASPGSPGQDQEKAQRPGRSHPRPGSRAATSAGIEGVMDHLAVQGSPPPNVPPARDPARLRQIESLQSAPPVIEADPDVDVDGSDKEPWLLPPSKYPRSSTRPRETHPGGHVCRPATRVRRPRRPADSPPSARRPGSSRAAESNSGRTSTSPVLTATGAPATPSTPTTTASASSSSKKKKKAQTDGTLGPGDHVGEGDSRIIYNVDLPLDAFSNIRDEVQWQKMYHLSGQVPRLVAVQGAVLPDGSIPIYRHPADESPPLLPFTPTVARVRQAVEGILGHSLNHVLIQLYRSGQDRISEHSDKTLDIVRGTSICNVSLGAQRTMILRTKASGTETADHDDSSSGAGRHTQRIPMPHESVFVLGPKTNMRWLHGIRADKRPDEAKSAEERAFNGERISLTFRSIGTFIHPTKQTIWGQGAVAKSEDAARPVIHGDAAETERLIQAFGRENRDSDFDWDAVYGGGFDVVNFVTPAVARVVLSGDPVADLRVQLALTENGMRYETEARGSPGQLVYISPDGKTTVTGDIDVLSYLAQLNESPRPGVDILRGGSQLEQIAELTASWRRCRGNIKDFGDLALWEQKLQDQEQSHGHHYISGAAFGVDDCAFWPVLRDIQRQKASVLSLTEYPHLWNYYHRVGKRGCVRAVLDE